MNIQEFFRRLEVCAHKTYCQVELRTPTEKNNERRRDFAVSEAKDYKLLDSSSDEVSQNPIIESILELASFEGEKKEAWEKNFVRVMVCGSKAWDYYRAHPIIPFETHKPSYPAVIDRVPPPVEGEMIEK